MDTGEGPRGPQGNMTELALRLSALQSPDVAASVRKLSKRYAKHATSADQVRAMMDLALGDRTLSAVLYEVRGG